MFDYLVLGLGVFIALPIFYQWLRNAGSYTKLDLSRKSDSGISVLIPARNEESNIEAVLQSVLESKNKNLEVIVADDHSTDNTVDLVTAIAQSDDRVKLIHVPVLPKGWGGKMHACHTLALAATKEWLLFLDADVTIKEGAASNMVAEAESRKVAMLSGFPNEITKTFGEKLLIPMIHFVLLGFLSLRRMRNSPNPASAAACGQVILCKAEIYHTVGGHEAIKASCHDGLDMPRLFRRNGYMSDLVDLSDTMSCRMYHSTWDTCVGLEKNAKYGMGSPQLIMVFTIMLLGGHVLPWLLLFWPSAEPWHIITLLVICSFGYIQRFMQCYLYQCSKLGALLHPLGVIGLMSIQWVALLRSIFGLKSQWKGRKIE